MHGFEAIELDIQPGTPDNPASVRAALLRYVRDEDGRLYMTSECNLFEEVEGQINRSTTQPAWPCGSLVQKKSPLRENV
jgi:hypothetical protein